MSALGWVLLTLFGLHPGPCGQDPDAHWRALLLIEINIERLEHGLRALEPEPALCAQANRRAEEIARSHGVEARAGEIRRSTTELFKAGYPAHRWHETSLIGYRMSQILPDWRDTARDGWWEVARGDYESVGIGLAFIGPQPVFSLVVALSRRTWDWRRATPLLDLASVREAMLERTNEKRLSRGLEPLVASDLLNLAAQRHAQDLLDRHYYDHRDLEGGQARDRIRRVGYERPRTVSENLAKGLFEPAEVVDRWMNSSGHRANILGPRVSEVGFGVAVGETEDKLEVLWVQVFAHRGDS